PDATANTHTAAAAARALVNVALRDRRALAATRSCWLSTSDGTSAFRDTVYVLATTSTPNASGNSQSVRKFCANSTARSARTKNVATLVVGRPPRIRSTNGPTSGAMTRNGPSVRTRNSSTRGRAASGETLKKIEPAIETVKNVSAAACTQCVIVSRSRCGGPISQLRAAWASRLPSLLTAEPFGFDSLGGHGAPRVGSDGDRDEVGLDLVGVRVHLDAD